MKILKPVNFLIFCIAISSCDQRFPVDKRYWTPEDYENVIFEIEYRTPEGEEYPRLSNPETLVVIRKLLDAENYRVILDDTELGLNFKNDMSQEFFDHYKDLSKVYSKMDIQDKYIYPEELVEIEKFGLGLQIQYFNLGNERIKIESDSPESAATQGVLRRNEQTIIKNFNLYLDHIKDERYFSSYASSLADGINTQFFKLIETFPEANYDVMLNKTSAMSSKTQVPEIKTALANLVAKLESLKKPAF